jgi:hypothetical protein
MEQPAAIEIDDLTVRFDTRNIPEGFSMRIEAGGKGDGKMSRTTGIFITVSIAVFLTSPTRADWKENAKAIDISGGEGHTLVTYTEQVAVGLRSQLCLPARHWG